MSVYAKNREVSDIKTCSFYHVMDIPGYGTTTGHWDLRETVNEYFGNTEFKGKRVLELGTASGFLCFSMEKLGADVVAYDLSPKDQWDLLYSFDDSSEQIKEINRISIQRLNNAYWFAHERMKSKAKVCHGSIYKIPEQIGKFDIVTFGSILLHLRDPLRAIQNSLKFVKDKIIIVEMLPEINGPFARFMPELKNKNSNGGWLWWIFSPDLFVSFLKLLGFKSIDVSYSSHFVTLTGKKRQLYTIVASKNG